MIALALIAALLVAASHATSSIQSVKRVNGTYALGYFLLDAFISEQQHQNAVTSYLNITSLGAKNDLSAAALLAFSDDNWPPSNSTNCRAVVKSANFALSLTKITRQIAANGVFSVGLANVKRDTVWFFAVSDCIANAVNQFFWTATFTTLSNNYIL